jgi:hypothetical protein
MSESRKQFQRVQRAFMKVLDNKNRKPEEYEDDVWGFFMNCWHLTDWIKNDIDGVARATREKIEFEVNSHPALMMVGKLANKQNHINVTRGMTKAGSAQATRGRVTGGAYIDNRSGPRNPGKDGQEIMLLVVVDKKGDEISVKKLATDAMKNWMAIIKKYRI